MSRHNKSFTNDSISVFHLEPHSLGEYTVDPKSGRKPKKAESAPKGVDTPGVVAGLTVHPTRRLLPAPTPAFLDELAISIRDGGLLEPVVVDAAGLLIDGFARAQAWSAINPTEPVPKRTENVTDPAAYILATWIREERTPAQRALAASRLMPQMRAEAKERQRKAGGAHPQKVAGAGLATQYAADAAGTNRQYVNDALNLLENAPDIVALIDTGHIATITQAQRASAQPKKKRADSLRRIASGESPEVVLRIKPLSASDRWLTPRYIVKAVQGVFGGKIALDPATEPDNPTSATAFCYEAGPTSGLEVPWPDKKVSDKRLSPR